MLIRKKLLEMNQHFMKPFTLFVVLSIFLTTSIFGATSPDQIEYQGNSLTKNGQGTRIIFFMKVYEGSLYLETASSNAQEIISLDSPMAIRIDVTSEMVTAEAMKKALSEGLIKSTGNNTKSISNEIDQLSSSFNSTVSSDDYYEFIYLPERGTHVLKNHEMVELIKGMEFKKAFFGIFLSDNPIQKNLKKAMLGG
jgi:hypothetical protein